MERTWNSSIYLHILLWWFIYQTTREFGFSLTLKKTWIYALVISNKSLTWQISRPSVMFYFILPYLTLYINCPTFTHTKGKMQKVKTWFICPAISPPCQRIVCVVKTEWYIILIGRAHLQQKADAWDIRISRIPRAFYRVRTLDSPPLWSQGFSPFVENGLREFLRAKWAMKTRSINTINWIFLPKIKLNG